MRYFEHFILFMHSDFSREYLSWIGQPLISLLTNKQVFSLNKLKVWLISTFRIFLLKKQVILGYVFICCRRNALLQIGTPLKPSLLGSDVITLHPKLVGSLLSYYSPTLPPRSAALLRYSAGEKQPLDFCYHLSGGYKGTGHLDSLKELCIK